MGHGVFVVFLSPSLIANHIGYLCANRPHAPTYLVVTKCLAYLHSNPPTIPTYKLPMILKPICKSNYLGKGREKEEGLQHRLPEGNLSTNHDRVRMGFQWMVR